MDIKKWACLIGFAVVFLFFGNVIADSIIIDSVPSEFSESIESKIISREKINTEDDESEYIPGEIIVKFRENAADTLQQQETTLYGKQFKPLREVPLTSSLDKLNKKYNTGEFKPVFKNFRRQKEKLRALRQKINLQKERQAVSFTKEEGQLLKSLKHIPKEEEIPALDRIYKVKLGKNQSVKQAVFEYSQDPNIEYAHPNYIMQLHAELLPSLPLIPDDYYLEDDANPGYWREGSWEQNYPDLWGLKNTQTIEAWNLFDENDNGIIDGDEKYPGEDIVVAVIDTGVDYNHEDLFDNIWVNPEIVPDVNGDGTIDIHDVDLNDNGQIESSELGYYGEDADVLGYDFSGNGEEIAPDNNPQDYYGHGSHCSGTIAAVGNNAVGLTGVAYRAKIMPVKIFPNSTIDVCAQGIRYAAEAGADVLSNSWGPNSRQPSEETIEEAIEYAYETYGCVVVFSAGNADDDVGWYSPANHENTIAVAATGYNDQKAGFSNFGEKIDVSAPGGNSGELPELQDLFEEVDAALQELAQGDEEVGAYLVDLFYLVLDHIYYEEATRQEVIEALKDEAYNEILVLSGSAPSMDTVINFLGLSYDWGYIYQKGNNILSSISDGLEITERRMLEVSPGYYRIRGTSMACPHVAGLAALVKSRYPDSSPDDIRSRIIFGADNIDSINPDYVGLLGTIGRMNSYSSLTITPQPVLKLNRITRTNFIPGGEASIVIRIKNLWEEVTNVSAILATDHPLATIQNPTIVLGDIAQGPGKGNTDNPFLITLAENITFGEVINFTLTVNGDGSYEKIFTFTTKISYFNDVGQQSGLSLNGIFPMAIVADDYSGDGYPDIYSMGFFSSDLYRNNQDGTFVDAEEEAGVYGGDILLWCPLFLDINNDAAMDLFLARKDEDTLLFLSNGDNTFTDITETSGLSGTTCYNTTAFDYNNDGFTDICAHSGTQLFFLRNNGDETFSRVTGEVGLPEEYFRMQMGQIVPFDSDNDGDQDFFITHYYGDSYEREGGIRFYRNNEGGSFTEVTQEVGLDVTRGNCWGVAAADYDEDGDIDLLLTGFSGTVDDASRSQLYTNDGTGYFTEVTASAGDIGGEQEGFRGTEFFDYDNDGDLDICVAESGSSLSTSSLSICRNDDGTFTNVTEFALPAGVFPKLSASVICDYNNDGTLDVYAPAGLGGVGTFLENVIGKEQNWIKIRLEDDQGSRIGYGARVYVRTGTKTQLREVHAASQETTPLHFGLGDATIIDEIEVHWPISGKSQALTDVTPNQLLTITAESYTYLEAITPNPCQIGEEIILSGNLFGAIQGSGYVEFPGELYPQIISWSDTEIVCVVPEGAASGSLFVVTDTGERSNNLYFYEDAPPQIKITFPKDGDYTGNDLIIEGKVIDDAGEVSSITVYVDGILHGTGGVINGDFAYEITGLASGERTITITAEDEFGQAHSESITVTVVGTGTFGWLKFSSSTYSVKEEGSYPTIMIRVNRTGNKDKEVTVDYEVSGGTATPGEDYYDNDYLTSGRLVFAPGDTLETFKIIVRNDTEAEANETIYCTLSNPSGGAGLTNPQIAVVTILDNDGGTLQFSEFYPLAVEDEGSRTITVKRVGKDSGAISVDYQISDGTATLGQDYTLDIPPTGTFTFNNGETEKTFNVGIINDAESEGDETVNLILTNPTGEGAVLGEPSEVILLIIDDDGGALQFSQAAYEIAEDGGSRIITVKRIGKDDGEISVDYATGNGTAIAGEDYIATSGTLSFDSGQTEANFSISITDDTEIEDDETVILTLSNPTGEGATLGSPSIAIVTILDNEGARLHFSKSEYTGSENGGSKVITVMRTNEDTNPVSVDYTTSNGTAIAGEDYIATSGTLSFDSGQTEANFSVFIIDDDSYEGNETINLALSNPTGEGAILCTPSTAVLNIQEDEGGVFKFSSSSYTVHEHRRERVITVNRTGRTGGEITVDYATSDGTATAGEDYTATSGTLTFEDEETVKDFSISIIDNTVLEEDETVHLTLSNPMGEGAVLGSPSTATVTILDNEGGTFQFSHGAYGIDENGGGQAITVTRTGKTGGTVTVDYATSDGTAIAGEDYITVAGTLTFSNGQMVKTFTVPIIDDTEFEGDGFGSEEIIHLTLGNPQGGGARLGSPVEAELRIRDNEGGSLSFSQSEYTVREDGGSGTITVIRTGRTGGTVEVDYATSDGTAVAGEDYLPASGTFTFTDGETVKIFTIDIINNTDPDGDKTVALLLSNPRYNNAALRPPFSAELRIIDDDASFTDAGADLPGPGMGDGSLAWGDYDNDGDLDLAVGNYGATRIYKNTDTGLIPIEGELLDADLGSLAWGDYDNDGDLDLAIGNFNITKIYQNSGSDTFEDIGIELSGNDLGSLAWGDYDNDGDLDLAIGGTGRIYMNYYDGVLGYRRFSDTGVRLGYSNSLAWGDYDNDGDLDLAVGGTDATKIYENNNSAFVEIETELACIDLGSLAWGDYDNDGDLDLAICGGDYSLEEVAITKIYKNNGGSDDNTFEDIGAGLDGVIFSSLAWGDYDNDGDLDLAVCGESLEGLATYLYKNEGEVGFIEIDTNLPAVADGSLVWGDYDNNGTLDLALCGRDINNATITRVYLNNTDNLNIPPTPPANLTKSEEEGDTTILLKWGSGSDLETPDSGLYYNVRVGTSSGADDIVSGVYGTPLLGNYLRPKVSDDQLGIRLKNLPADTYYWSVQTIDTSLKASEWSTEKEFVYGPDYFIAIDLLGLRHSSLAWGDYDNDDYVDLAICGMSVELGPITRIYHNNGDDTFDTGVELYGVYDGSLAWGDYDNDGYLDLVASGLGSNTKIYHNNGDGTFDIGVELDLHSLTQGDFSWGDYDNDGDLDLAVCGRRSGESLTIVYQNNGDDTFDTGAELTGVARGSLAWGDYDNDGYLDLALCGYSEGGDKITRIYRNDSGEFVDIGAVLTGVSYSSLAWGDYDNDGYLDLAVCGSATEGVITKIYRNNSGEFIDIPAGLIGVAAGSLAWGDYDNNGYLDLAICGEAEGEEKVTIIYKNNGDDTFDMGAELHGVYYGDLAWGNYDKDGYLDLAICGAGAEGFVNKIYKNNIPLIGSNIPPISPVNLNYTQQGDSLLLQWHYGVDWETPANGLYYNLRVGTVPGGNDIVSGVYGTPLLGNYLRPKLASDQLGIRLKNLPEGIYYWSVKTIDTSLTASAWSKEETFIISFYSLSGEVTLEGGTAVLTDIVISLSGAMTDTINPAPDGSYSFADLGGGFYTITPSLEDYHFFPASRLYSPLDSDQLNQDFIGLYEDYDSDEDGLPDWWEWTYFGEGNLSYGQDDDPDGDGWTDWEEYTHDTDPNDAGSIPLFSISGEVSLEGSGDVNSVVWVKVPEISAQDSTIIYMYYGNPDAYDDQTPEDVWDSNYLMVQHLQEAPANGEAGHIDSTFNNFDGTPRSFDPPATTDGIGQIDGADIFDNAGDGNGVYINGSSGTGSALNIYNEDMTISAWAKWTGTGGTIVARAKPEYITYWLRIATDKACAGIYTGIEHRNVSTGSILNPDTWYHVAGVFDREANQAYIYVDGILEGNGPLPDAPAGNDGTTKIGCRNDYNDCEFNGTIDEVRISDIARSPAWIKACYYSELDELITFGDEEVVYGSQWNYRRALYIDPANIDETLTNFPLCVKLDSSRITYTGSGGLDIRFTDALGNPLKYEIEETELIKVLLTLTGTSTDTIYPESNGGYIFTDLEKDSYILVPSLEGYYFFPYSRLYPLFTSDQVNQDFIGLHENYDSDEDGLPDWWEWTYFGEGNLSYGPDDDPDEDSHTNLNEYTYDTDPTDPESFYVRPPEFINLSDKLAIIDQLLEFTVEAQSPDDPEATLMYSADNLPSGAVFNPNTQLFSWSPAEYDKGSYEVSFTVSDSYNSTTENIVITTVVIEEVPICTISGAQQFPDIYEDRIVWQDGGQGGGIDADIYMYDISTGDSGLLHSGGSRPAIYEDQIVWTDHREGYFNPDIYLYDLTIEEDTPICTNPYEQRTPDIYENKVIWKDSRNGGFDIYMYDFSTGEETPVCTASSDQRDVGICEDKIVWRDSRSGNSEVYLYDLLTSEETQITSGFASVIEPAIYEDKIVWCDWRSGDGGPDIYLYDVSTEEETQITATGSRDERFPAVYGDKIVWTGFEGTMSMDSAIYLYDLSRNQELCITDTLSGKYYPSVYQNKIVWQDNRGNGSWDIYMAELTYAPEMLSVSPAEVNIGETLTITGKNFGDTQGTSTVEFENGAVCSIQSWSDTEIICTVPASAQTGLIRVITGGGVSNGITVTIW